MYQKTESEAIIRLSDSACIPADESNNDYLQYLEWVEGGGVPEPYVVPPITVEQQIGILEASITSRRLREAVLNKGQGIQFVKDVDDQIEALRLQLP